VLANTTSWFSTLAPSRVPDRKRANSVAHDPTPTEAVEEFLQLRRNVRHDTALLEKLDDQLRDMSKTAPDHAADILHALSHSDDKRDRDAAAIYVAHLLTTRHDRAKNIIGFLLHDSEKDIRRQARQTLDEAVQDDTITATEAARLHAHR
jgi:hypothetical protein